MKKLRKRIIGLIILSPFLYGMLTAISRDTEMSILGVLVGLTIMAGLVILFVVGLMLLITGEF